MAPLQTELRQRVLSLMAYSYVLRMALKFHSLTFRMSLNCLYSPLVSSAVSSGQFFIKEAFSKAIVNEMKYQCFMPPFCSIRTELGQ